jgi:hypothetical protein
MCNSCEVLNINGVNCHEIGCPDSLKDHKVECKCCDNTFNPEYKGQKTCSDECYREYWNIA